MSPVLMTLLHKISQTFLQNIVSKLRRMIIKYGVLFMSAQLIPVPTPAKAKPLNLQVSLTLTKRVVLAILRFSLSLTFFWFGILKVFNLSPVIPLLQNSFSLLAKQPFLGMLGFGEILIAIGLIIPKLSRFTLIIMIVHLLGTLSVALFT